MARERDRQAGRLTEWENERGKERAVEMYSKFCIKQPWIQSQDSSFPGWVTLGKLHDHPNLQFFKSMNEYNNCV